MTNRIRKLEEVVVNRIAAGEIIQRPSNALKELIENSLDAKSSQIQVVVKQGGLKLLQIQDNGTGIQKEDLGIVCERFTTSKLKEFKDLQEISTYGFRGEALASISHVSHLAITTRTKDEKCAWRLTYKDGKPLCQPKPCAGNQGTMILAEDMFYNVPTRKKALKNPSEEHGRTYDVISHYSIHNATVGFTLKKAGDSTTDLRTPPNSTSKGNIQIVYGSSLAKELLEVSYSDEQYQFSVNGLISNANFSPKKCIFLLFINHRLVESSALRKAIESVYTSYLPKNSHPFIYLSLEIAPQNVDVNVHPTKHEVCFLHQDSIILKTQQAVDAVLLGCNYSRTFYTQTLLPGASAPDLSKTEKSNQSSVKEKTYAHQMVRTDSTDQKLDKFLVRKDSQNTSIVKEADISQDHEKVHRREIKLSSVLNLQKEIELKCHSELREIIAGHTYVGSINPQKALIQYSTKLYIANTCSLSEEMFYQVMIKDFGNFGTLELSSPANVEELALIALDLEESGWTEEHGSKEELAQYVLKLFISKALMMDDYFSMKIDATGNILTLPYVLDGYVPWLEGLPMYVLRLATEVNWDEEEECFESICRETAKLYRFPKWLCEDRDPNQEEKLDTDDVGEKPRDWQWVAEHMFYPTMKKILSPPQSFAQDTTFLQIANLPDLYKVFERC